MSISVNASVLYTSESEASLCVCGNVLYFKKWELPWQRSSMCLVIRGSENSNFTEQKELPNWIPSEDS
ncbi:UNVERIFIED_CONTAM: hypothetical protein NCL1_08319 [Trichonephila clavipes]